MHAPIIFEIYLFYIALHYPVALLRNERALMIVLVDGVLAQNHVTE